MCMNTGTKIQKILYTYEKEPFNLLYNFVEFNKGIFFTTRLLTPYKVDGQAWHKLTFYTCQVLIIYPITISIDAIIMLLMAIITLLKYAGKKLLKQIIKSFIGRVLAWSAVILTILFFINLFTSGLWRGLFAMFTKALGH